MIRVNVPVERIKEFHKQLNKISKKAEKYGVEFSYSTLSQETETIEVDVPDCYYMKEKHQREIIPFIINSGLIKIGNYEVVGVIERKNDVVIINGADDEIAKRFQNISEYRCDHCNSNRKRNTQIILKNIISGEEIVVGKSCVAEYTGVTPQHHFKWNFELANLNEFSKGHFAPTLSIEKMFDIAVKLINQNGFESAKNWDNSTACKVLSIMRN